MKKQIEEAKDSAKEAVGAARRHKGHHGEGQIADESGDVKGTFDEAPASAKEIFQDARANQEEDYIRRGKPD